MSKRKSWYYLWQVIEAKLNGSQVTESLRSLGVSSSDSLLHFEVPQTETRLKHCEE